MRGDEEKKLREMLAERRERLNDSFVWTPENKRKIVELNNGLLERYREAYDELVRVSSEYEERFCSGDTNYQDYTIDVEFWYNAPESQSEEENDLWENLCEETLEWGPPLLARSAARDRGLESGPLKMPCSLTTSHGMSTPSTRRNSTTPISITSCMPSSTITTPIPCKMPCR